MKRSRAIEEDNQESRISEVKPMLEKNDLQMGNFLKINENNKKQEEGDKNKDEESQGSDTDFRPENAITH